MQGSESKHEQGNGQKGLLPVHHSKAGRLSEGFVWSGFSGQMFVYAVTAIVLFFVSYPIVMLLLGSAAPPRGAANQLFSFEGYRVALAQADSQKAMLTSLVLATTEALLATGVAIFLAWAITRTNVPGRRVFHALLVINFFLPALPRLLAWTMLLSPKAGTLNVFLRDMLGLDGTSGPLNIYSYGGIIFVNVLNWSGFIYLIISPAFRAMDSSLEESGRMSGASNMQLLWRITVRLLSPAILGGLALAFIRMVESFETELLLGAPAGIYVFSTQIYYYLTQEQVPKYPQAIALSVVLFVLATIVISLQKWLLGRRSYVTVSGKSFRATPTDLGWWKHVVFVLLAIFFVIDIFLPGAMLVAGSFQESSVFFRIDGWTLRHWEVLMTPALGEAFSNTLTVATVASTIGVCVTTLISYIVHRTQARGRAVLDFATWMPYLLPGFILSLGFLWAVLRGIPLPWTLYGTLQLFMIVFVIKLLPTGSRLVGGTMVQISRELEEAAAMSGATRLQTIGRIIVPSLLPSLIVTWLIFMIMVMRDFSTVLLLYGPNSSMLSIAFYNFWQGGDLGGAASVGLLMTFVGITLVGALMLTQRASNLSGERLM